MKANKPLKEAILRAPESTAESTQAQQEQLYHMSSEPTNASSTQQKEDLINESATNRVKSLQNLRDLEYEVEKKSNKGEK